MKIKFGEFEEVEEPTKVKEYLTAYFENVKPDKFDSIFLAYPHQCFSSAYEPSKHVPSTLEIYMFSLPDEFEKSPNLGFSQAGLLNLDGEHQLELYGNQRDMFRINGAISRDFQEVKDVQGVRVAIQRGNQLWFMMDLFHKFGVDGAPESSDIKRRIDAIMNFITETLIHPLTEEEQEAKFAKQLGKSIMSGVNDQVRRLESEVKVYENDIKANETRTSVLLRDYNDRQMLLEQYHSMKKPEPFEMIEKIKRMGIVEKFYLVGLVPTINTKQITLGPFDYGKWTIGLGKDQPFFKHDLSGKVRHAYEYSDTSLFCMGGFAPDYVTAMARGKLDAALSIARLEITNYSISTKMTSIEVFLRGMMGKDFDKILEKVKEEKFKTSDTIYISQIYGLEVTYVGTRAGSETGERVVIKYD